MRRLKYETDWACQSLVEIDCMLDEMGCPKLPDLCPDVDVDDLDIGQIVIGRLRCWPVLSSG